MLREGGCKRLPLEVTGWWAGLPDERLKWRREVGEALARARLLSLPDLDAHLAKARACLRSGVWVSCCLAWVCGVFQVVAECIGLSLLCHLHMHLAECRRKADGVMGSLLPELGANLAKERCTAENVRPLSCRPAWLRKWQGVNLQGTRQAPQEACAPASLSSLAHAPGIPRAARLRFQSCTKH